jgi:hypothetical protein
MRRNDLNAPKRIECQQVRVPSDYVICVTAYGEFEELVVLRIAARFDALVNVHVFCFTGQGGQETSNIVLIDVPPELLSVQDFIDFSKDPKAGQHFPFFQCQVKGLARFGIGQE